jgi:hypothetical protein
MATELLGADSRVGRSASRPLRAGRALIQELNVPERIAALGVLLTPFALLVDYRAGFSVSTSTVTYVPISEGGGRPATYEEVIGATQVLWMAAGAAGLIHPRARAGFRSVTTMSLGGLLALILVVTAAQDGLDRFAVHALAATLIPLVPLAGVLTNPQIRVAKLRLLVLGFVLLVALAALATLAQNAWGSLTYTEPPGPATHGNVVPNASFENGTEGWSSFNGGGGSDPDLATTRDPRYVEQGAYSGYVTVANSERMDRYKAVAVTTPAAVEPGREYYIRAYVSGPADRTRPLRLDLLDQEGDSLSSAIRPLGNGHIKGNTAAGWTMEGIFEPPNDGTVTKVWLTIWRVIPPRADAWWAIDGAVVRLKDENRGYSRPIEGLEAPSPPGTTLSDRFDLFLFGATTDTGAALALVLLLVVAVPLGRPAQAALGLILLAALLATRTRGALLGASAGAITIALLNRRLRISVLGAAAASIALFVLLSDRPLASIDQAISFRLDNLEHHGAEFLESPIIGHGISSEAADSFRAAHNTLLGIANAAGVGAVLLWLAAWLIPVVRGLRADARSLPVVTGAAVLAAVLVEWNTTGSEVLIHSPPTNLLPLVLGVALAQSVLVRRTP